MMSEGSAQTPHDDTKLTACEFFAGMGLVRRALEAPPHIGAPMSARRFRTLYANDFSPSKQMIYNSSFEDADSIFDSRDVREVVAADVPAADLWTASFPCTDLSLAGRGAGIHAGESSAVWPVLALLEAREETERPGHLLFENVMGLATRRDGADFHTLVERLNQLGYGVDVMRVDAQHFTPQSRPRLFIIATGATLGRTIEVAAPDLCASDVRPERLLQAMCARPDLNWHARRVAALPVRTNFLSDIVENLADDSPRWWSKERTKYFLAQIHPSHRRRADEMASAQTEQYAAGFRRVRAIADDVSGVVKKRSVVELRTDGVAGCLRTPKGGSAKQILFVAGGGRRRVRHMTPLECARLQGVESLPEGFSDSELLFALGDAVCVPAVRWVLDHLFVRERADAGSANEAGLFEANAQLRGRSAVRS